MLTAEIKVNGCLIGHIYAHNTGYVHAQNHDECSYEYHIYDVTEGSVIKSGRVEHARSSGAFALIQTIIEELPYRPYKR